MEADVADDRRAALELAAQPERLVARPVRGALCGVVGVELEELGLVGLEGGGEVGGVGEGDFGDGEEEGELVLGGDGLWDEEST